jgi:hypothetical protein
MPIPTSKLILPVFIALIVCLGLGFGWGAAGRSELRTALEDAKQQLDLAEARSQILDGRVSLYNNNFGDASRHFEDAKAPLRRIKQRGADAGKRDAASGIDAALGQLEEAQRLTGKLDLSANNKAGDALEAIKVAVAAAK